eukprot:CAMPEP_0118918154 /NCGR_PEP_ID=MMETSP1166-20130328/17735_1 /TAXON_ID=1104430 /ORGANISM="Chrysoreinhardia sp, Strain CCMP3193" /LENGTH=133 /DNA_ID=CAMNT_0006858401 /DNA_START=130 /DNA_END=528 /DNA_ORIENTATION=+
MYCCSRGAAGPKATNRRVEGTWLPVEATSRRVEAMRCCYVLAAVRPVRKRRTGELKAHVLPMRCCYVLLRGPGDDDTSTASSSSSSAPPLRRRRPRRGFLPLRVSRSAGRRRDLLVSSSTSRRALPRFLASSY